MLDQAMSHLSALLSVLLHVLRKLGVSPKMFFPGKSPVAKFNCKKVVLKKRVFKVIVIRVFERTRLAG